ncbi:MAG TPA: hypothetical protein VEL82_05330 [Thermoplasmata archaeon]|nr:hypothetical protein [Thermoplasmata archaeon]
MASALVVGDAGTGLTTFVGLLYAAQVRLGTEEEDEFRFSADRESIRGLEAIYGDLVAGRFPERDLDWDEHPLSFVFGLRNGWLRGLRPRAGRGEGGFETVRLEVGGISAPELAELARHDAILAESTRRLLRSQVLLFLVDASRLDRGVDGDPPAPLARYDRLLAGALGVLARFAAAAARRRDRRLYPIFVVTKLDRLPGDARRRLGLPDAGPPRLDGSERPRVGRDLLAAFLPQTARALADLRQNGGLRLEPPRWFFSALRIVNGPAGRPIARRSRVPVGGWEPEYPFEEYRALLSELGRLARGLPAGSADR